MKGSPPQSWDFPRGPGQHRRLTACSPETRERSIQGPREVSGMVLARLSSGRVNEGEVTELLGRRRGGRCSNHQQVVSHVQRETRFRTAEEKKIPGNKLKKLGNAEILLRGREDVSPLLRRASAP